MFIQSLRWTILRLILRSSNILSTWCHFKLLQTKIEEPDRDKTTFISHHGLHRFIRMPSSLKDAPGTSQRAMGDIPSAVKGQYALVYLDDTVAFSKTVFNPRSQLPPVLGLLSEARVLFQLKECFFFHDKVVYLHHVIKARALAISHSESHAFWDRSRRQTWQNWSRSSVWLPWFIG